MASLSGLLLGGLQLIAGIFLTATGLGAGIGVKLIITGGLSLLSAAIGGPGRTGLDNDPRYGFDNAQNTTVEGQPIPLVYGRDRWAPPIISVLFDREGETEVLKYLCLVSAGGPRGIKAIEDVRLNGSPAASLGATIETRLGTQDQTVIHGFERTGAAYSAGVHLGIWTTPVPPGEYVFDMKSDSDELVLRLVWPNGLYHLNSDGSTAVTHASVSVAWKPIGAPDSSYKFYRVPLVNGVRQSGDWDTDGGVNLWSIPKESRVPVRANLRMPFDNNNTEGHPPRGRYTVRVRGERANTAHEPNCEPDLAGWNEIQNAPASGGYAYPGLALLAVTVPASGIVSGGIPRTDGLIDGRLVYDFRTGEWAWSRNPLLVVYDLITDEEDGLGRWLDGSDVDAGIDGTFRACANRADGLVTRPDGVKEARYECDLVMSTKADAKDWFSQILSGCRMQIVGAGGLLKVIEDKEQGNDGAFDERASTDAILVPGEPQPPGENAWSLVDSAPVSLAQTTPPEVLSPSMLVPSRSNILADDATKISSLTVRQQEEALRFSAVLVKYMDRDQAYRERSVTLRDVHLDVAGLFDPEFFDPEFFETSGSIADGPLVLGEAVKGQTSKIVGWVTDGFATGSRTVRLVVQPGVSPAFTDGEEIVGLESGASFHADGTGYTRVPERVLEVQLFGLTRYSQVLREARYHLGTAQSRTLFASWGIAGGDIQFLPGQVVALYSTRLAWTGKRFTVLAISYSQKNQGRIEAREYSEAPFEIVDRIPTVPFQNPGGSVPPGLREPADPVPKGQSVTATASQSATAPSSGGGSGGSGVLTQTPLSGTALKK